MFQLADKTSSYMLAYSNIVSSIVAETSQALICPAYQHLLTSSGADI